MFVASQKRRIRQPIFQHNPCLRLSSTTEKCDLYNSTPKGGRKDNTLFTIVNNLFGLKKIY